MERHARTRPSNGSRAPGQPGKKPRWTTGAKTAVGTAVSNQSRVWFTISHGVLNEIYFPSIDEANTRYVQFVVTDGRDFFSDEQRDAEHETHMLHPFAPGFSIETRCRQQRYRLTKEVFTDPKRDAVLVNAEFEPFNGASDLQLYAMVDPHIADQGSGNDAWVGEYKGTRMLFARRQQAAMALACSSGFGEMTCGYIGVSDGYTELRQNKRLTACYSEAPQGNVGLCGRIPLCARRTRFCLALAFGGHAAEAGQQARAALLEDSDDLRDKFVQAWEEKQRAYFDLGGPRKNSHEMYRVSTAVLETHESKRFPGGVVASLAVPWGFDRGDKDIGGYHVIWPRDMAQAALGKLACGDAESARRTLFYLECTQERDGHWPQNMWLDGTAHWTAIQMDAASYPILLANILRREHELGDRHPWEMIRSAAGFLVRNGPVTEQERWEENAGYDPNTMAVEIAALLAAADFADDEQERGLGDFLRDTADAWNDAIDELTYATGTALAREHGVAGYYIRIAPPDVIRTGLSENIRLRLKNLPEHRAAKRAVEVVSPGTLALVRFGLRAAHDQRIVDTLKVVDATLKAELSNGPVWHRYTDDGYGEKQDGTPFDGTGKGRGWPLLSGERAHYEIAAGNLEGAERLLQAISSQTSECGLIPEQVWDTEDIPARELFNGKPTGSGMPLVWAHSEYIRALRSLCGKRVWDTPPQPVQRYQVECRSSRFQIWTFQQQRGRLRAGKDLRLDLWNRARIRWSSDEWKSVEECETAEPGIGLHYALLTVAQLKPGAKVRFTMFWPEADKWEGHDFEVNVI
ncbi:MAG: glucan 1,4-alpha-glucosidase [Acidobacteriaceae bacterium]|nr:glucan 1,4-alpha-glucosidase [Acidobacteriaceae bacterium]